MPNPVPTSRRQNTGIRQTPVGRAGRRIGTKTRSQTGRPMGEPRVGKEGAGIPEDVATKPQGRWDEWPLLVFLESKHSFL